jgi:2-C-methyl-D-erythritol 4-phosphate cytidylyltransferase
MRRAAPDGQVAVIIPAAGSGRRLGSRTPKQFLRLATAPILVVTVGRFARHRAVGSIVVAVPPAHVRRTERLLAPIRRRRAIMVVAGGKERQDSVRSGLAAAPRSSEIILVHDAVRPFVTAGLIDEVVDAARRHGAAICGVPVTETVKRVVNGIVATTLDRNGLWAVQTPQAFRAGLLREAHARAYRDGFQGTDEAMLVERLGHPVRMIRGHADNLKITTPADLRRARGLVAGRAVRAGPGSRPRQAPGPAGLPGRPGVPAGSAGRRR